MLTYTKISESVIGKDNFPGVLSHVEITDGTYHCVLTEEYFKNYAERVKNMKIYEDDVWVISYPKCGTTWAQEIVWLLNNNLNYEVAKETTLEERFPFLEQVSFVQNFVVDTIKNCEEKSRPRHIKTHLPKFLLPKQLFTVKPKIIYVTRNPKDAAVSVYYHSRHFFGYSGTKEEYFTHFLDDKLLYSPMNENVLEFWKLRNESNVLFLHYEDMKRNIKEEVTKIMKFLDKSYSDDQINGLCQHVSFESMKINPSVNKKKKIQMIKDTLNYVSKHEDFSFMREGRVGSFEKEMSEEMKEKFDKYMQSTELVQSGFYYKAK